MHAHYLYGTKKCTYPLDLGFNYITQIFHIFTYICHFYPQVFCKWWVKCSYYKYICTNLSLYFCLSQYISQLWLLSAYI
jgi:hypothetical protein